jgi:hypothetical protein
MLRLLMLSLVFALSLGLPHAAKAERNLPLAVVDIALVRPVAMVVSLASTAVYTGLAVPFYMMGVSDGAARAMVETPWWFTAGRPAGDFTHYYEPGPWPHRR